MTKYYCVGFSWHGQTPTSQLDRFIKDSIWENGYDNKFIDTVKRVPVGARLAAKTTYTRKENGKTISVLEVHALGTVTGNEMDGQTLYVDWDKKFKSYTLEGRGAYRSTISQVNNAENIRLIFHPPAEVKTASDPVPLAFDPADRTDDFAANLILYGPPGTGKTFHTINKAVAIADGIRENKLSNYYPDRTSLKDRFDELLIENFDDLQGQIAFVTFHQSMSYEDFVEGIKPVVNEEDEVIYDVEPGIFKKMANLAQNNWYESQKGKGAVTLSFEEAFTRLREDWEEKPEQPYAMKREGKAYTILGFTKSSIRFKKASGGTGHTMSIATLRDYYYDNRPVRTHGVGIYYPGILEKLKSYPAESTLENARKNYVLVIDEINRGNVSQIFGELITLIEEDKRLGRKEELSVTLPYSRERFRVPPNLFIAGTMNTADRSIEALDTALRRRFVFEEKTPEPQLLTPQEMLWKLWSEYEDSDWADEEFAREEKKLYSLIGFPVEIDNQESKSELWNRVKAESEKEKQVQLLAALPFTGVNLSALLSAINYRLEKLLGRDYTIGHAYLLDVRSVKDCQYAFQHKIIPLLQEYFYGDPGRIGLVIGEVFISAAHPSNVLLMKVSGQHYVDQKLYPLQDVRDWDEATFIQHVKAIYA